MTIKGISKYGVGQLNQITDHKGKKHFRGEKLLFMLGENNIQEVEQVYDPDHFIFQNVKPITKKEYEYYRNLGLPIPQNRLGVMCLCDCGSEAVMILSPDAPKEWMNKLICKNFAMYGIHQTSMDIKDGIMKLPKQLEQDHLMLDSDLERLYGKKE